MGMVPREEDYEIVPEERTATFELDKQHYLQVHHKYYIEKKYPWEYNDDALITLCNWCHFEVHQNENIPVYTERNSQLVETKLTPCSRCHGAGFFPQFSHIQMGACFKCDGERYEELIIIT